MTSDETGTAGYKYSFRHNPILLKNAAAKLAKKKLFFTLFQVHSIIYAIMRKAIVTLAVLSMLLGGGASASGQARPAAKSIEQSPQYVQDYINIISSAEPMKSASLGVMAMTVGGKTLVSHNADKKLIPASNTKLLSTGLAIHELGADFKFKTRIGYSGTVEDGVLKGDLYIIGGGDPTLGVKDTIVSYVDATFAKWYNAMKAAGIKSIDGRIIGDGRYFEGQLERDSWEYEDIGTYYGTGGNGLSFYRNVVDISVKAGSKVGAPISHEVTYPEMPWMTYVYSCTTGAKGTGDQLYLYTTDLAPIGDLRGTFAIDRQPKKEEVSNKFGALTCAQYFSKYLEKYSVRAKGGIADTDVNGNIRTGIYPSQTAGKAEDVEKLTIISTTESPSLKRIARVTNYESDNFYAETLLRTVSKKRTGSAAYDSCGVAASKVFKDLGIDDSYGIDLVDGSGLSRQDNISPDFFCRFLKAMMSSPAFPDYIETLLSPGKGSYSARMADESEALKKRIFLKSGSMNGVRCFSGYIVPSDGGKDDTIVFSVMVNNYSGPNWKVMGQLDKIIALIASMN